MVANVLFFLRGKEAAQPEKKCVIYAEIIVGGKKSTAFSTGLKVPVKFWMSVGNRSIKASSQDLPVSKSYERAERINNELNDIRNLAQASVDYLISMRKEVTAKSVRRALLHPEPIKPAIPEKKYIIVLDELIEALRPKRKGSTMLTYRTRRKNVNRWLNDHFLNDLLISDFSFQHFEDFQLYMITYLNDDGSRRFCKNNVNKHLTLINKVLKYGINKGYIKNNPIGQMGLEYEATKPPQYLLPLDRGRIYGCKMKTLSIERDVSVFLFNTGLAYTDYLTLCPEHLQALQTGEGFIKKERDKSGVYSIVPILEQTQEIIDKYGGIDKLPRPDISDLNKTLKILGEQCKSPYPLSTSTFRETFASMMENEYMIPERLLMFMMGHTNPRQLRNYSSVMPARILHELKKEKIQIPFDLSSFESLTKAS